MPQKKSKPVKKKKAVEKKPEAIPYHSKPANLTLENWQIALRKQFVAGKSFDREMTLNSFGLANFEQFRMRASAIDADFRCYDDALAFILETRETNRRVKLIEERYPTGDELEGILNTKLFPYQEKGVLFAAKAGRSMICDEMGLFFSRSHPKTRILAG